MFDLVYMPVPGAVLCSRQGLRTRRSAWHNGLDWCAPFGSWVHACASGVVVLVQRCAYTCPYGNRIVIQHGPNLFSVYAHLDEIKVEEGMEVLVGQVIGTVGDTTNLEHVIAHLHFELIRRGPRLAHTDYAARYDVLHVLAAEGLVLDGDRLVFGEPREYHEPALVATKAAIEYTPTIIGEELLAAGRPGAARTDPLVLLPVLGAVAVLSVLAWRLWKWSG